MSPSNLLAAALLVASAVIPFAANADPVSGTVLVNTCFSCHGTDGKSRGDMPTIAGKSEAFIVDRLKGFKSGEIESTVMGRIAKGFSDEEIDALAQYFAE